MNTAIKTDVQLFIKTIKNILEKNYLYNQEKYRYAKSITSSYLSWLRYSFSENVFSHAYMLYARPYKVKRFFNICGVFFKKHKKGFTLVFNILHITTIVGISIGIYILCLQMAEYLKKIDEIIDAALIIHYETENHNNILIKRSENFLRTLTAKHVLYSPKINEITAKLIVEVCQKPNIEGFIGKLLRELLEKQIIYKGTKSITSDFLHKNLIHEEIIYVKFRNLVISQLRKENIRKELLKIIVDFSRSDYASTVFTSQFGAALKNKQVIDTFVDGCRSKAFEIMDNDQYKSLASKKLRNMV